MLINLLGLGSVESGNGVGDLDVKLLGSLDDELSGPGRHRVGDLGSVLAVVHEKHLQVLGVVDDELVEAAGEKVAGLLVGTVTDLGLGDGTLEASADTGINTLGLSP